MSWFDRVSDPTIFGPDLLNLMQSAFDSAWQMHEADFPSPSQKRDLARDALAKAIIGQVEAGERDPDRLKHHGLRELLRFRN